MKWITNRDKEVLKTIYFNRFISTDQLTTIFFRAGKNGENKRADIICRKRLQRYRENGLIKSFFPAANTSQIHAITEKGVLVVSGLLNVPAKDLYYNPREDYLSDYLIQHSIKINDLYVSIISCKALVKRWQVERLNKQTFTADGKQYTVIPDVFMIYGNGKVKLYYIEVDNNTEAPKKFANKVTQYELLCKSNVVQDSNGGYFPKIVVVCDNQSRIDRLKAVTNTFLEWDYVLFDEFKDYLGGNVNV